MKILSCIVLICVLIRLQSTTSAAPGDQVARSQAKWLDASSNAKQLFTDKSSEYIPFDQQDFVVDAIRDVYTQSTPD